MTNLNSMDIVTMTQQALSIQNALTRESEVGGLDWPFEKGHFAPEDVAQAISLILNATLTEEHERVKTAMFYVLAVAVSWHEVSSYVDWDIVVDQLPHLSTQFDLRSYALACLGWSQRIRDIYVLEQYLDDEDTQEDAFDAMKQIWWDISMHDPAVKILMEHENDPYYWHRSGKPRKSDIPIVEFKRLYRIHMETVINNLHSWLAEHRELSEG